MFEISSLHVTFRSSLQPSLPAHCSGVIFSAWICVPIAPSIIKIFSLINCVMLNTYTSYNKTFRYNTKSPITLPLGGFLCLALSITAVLLWRF